MRDDSRVLPRFFAAAGARRTVAAHSGEPPVRPPSREYPSNFPLLIRDLLNYAGPAPATDTPTDCRMLPMLVILEPGTVRVCESSSCRPADAVHPRDRRILEERRVKAPRPAARYVPLRSSLLEVPKYQRTAGRNTDAATWRATLTRFFRGGCRASRTCP